MIARIWFVMKREYTTNGVLIQAQYERQVDLLGNAGTTVINCLISLMKLQFARDT